MATFTFTGPNGKLFDVSGPPGLTQEQARAAFDQQLNSGALVGTSSGTVVNSGSQASQGLVSAQSSSAQVQTAPSSATGSRSQSLAAAGGTQAGSFAGTASGLSAAVGVGASSTALSSISTSGSGASTAITTINKNIASTPLTDPVGIADFAKQGPALVAIQPMTQAETTGVLAQAKKLTGQSFGTLTDEKGLGAFGLGAEQLEKAGVLKPGMSVYIKSGASTLANLLKSPAAYTGKDGIKSADDLLNNPPKQELIQQDLMKQGLSTLGALGVPPQALSAAGAAGAALNSAVSPEQAANFFKGKPVNNTALAEKFSANTRDGAYATTLAKEKVPPAFKAEVIPEPAADTVNRESVNAASVRVVGNPKVPEPNYGPSKPTQSVAEQNAGLAAAYSALTSSLASIESKSADVAATLAALETRQTISESDLNNVDAKWDSLRIAYLALAQDFATAQEKFDAAPAEVQRTNRTSAVTVNKTRMDLAFTLVDYKIRINALTKKIQGPRGTGNSGE
jgi:hypothetical protein